MSISPRVTICSPVAVMTMSASSTSPDVSVIPVAVNVSIVSVTTEALPDLMALNRSLLGMRHSRWSHGKYEGVKWVSTS